MKKGTGFKKSNICRSLVLIIVFSCLLISINSTSGFYNVNGSDSFNSSMEQIIESSHLIELDLNHEGTIFVQESIVFSVSGEEALDNLIIHIPETAEVTSFKRIEMMGTDSKQIEYLRDQDALYFNDSERLYQSSMPALYEISYVLEDGKNAYSHSFSKVLHDSEKTSYPISRLAVVVNYPEGVHVSLTDAIGNALKADEIKDESNTVSFTWTSPDFDVLLVSTHKAVEQGSAKNIQNIFVLALVSVTALVLVFVLYSKRKKNADIHDLEDRYEALLAVILQTEEDRKNKVISDQEFKALHKKYKQQAMEVKKKMAALQNK
ncbi:hypothetical protein V7O66_06160 [Methanolobus sp. ZRKC3]|uniref:hypothetical protein n=1 Tax=Methanolobus sp. ZRKC3 TaxID=3125786 RepID=UPI003249A1EF